MRRQERELMKRSLMKLVVVVFSESVESRVGPGLMIFTKGKGFFAGKVTKKRNNIISLK